MENERNENKQGVARVIIVLGIAVVLCAVVLTIALVAVIFGGAKAETTNAYIMTSQQATSARETSNVLDEYVDMNGNDNNHETVVVDNAQAGDTVTTTASDKIGSTTKNEAIEYYEKLSPNGDNILSDNCENEYIKLISNKYDVDSDLLVAIYSTPDTGNNFVLQFSGKKQANGNYVKNPDELEKVYQIDKDRNIKIATGTDKGNVGVSYAEGMLCFHMVKTIIMDQYPDYFTDLDK